jgi:hypothetical protein
MSTPELLSDIGSLIVNFDLSSPDRVRNRLGALARTLLED